MLHCRICQLFLKILVIGIFITFESLVALPFTGVWVRSGITEVSDWFRAWISGQTGGCSQVKEGGSSIGTAILRCDWAVIAACVISGR